MKEQVLIMGGSYFIGKKIVDVLLENNYSVYTLNRGTIENTDSRIVNLKCDRNNFEQMKETLMPYKFDIVIDVSGFNKFQAELLYKSLNTAKLNVFVYISSSAVYDVENLTIPFSEDATLKENNYWTSYGQNKIESETYLSNNFNDPETNLIIVRPPYVYGENNHSQRESFIFHHICNDQPIIIPNANTKLQFIYTTDLANIIIKLCDIPLEPVSIWNVGNRKSITTIEWIECCSKIVGKAATVIAYDYKLHNKNEREFFPFYDYDNILDVSKINKIFSSETDFMLGLQNSYLWYKNNQHNIIFKESITQNEQNILSKINQ